MRGSSARWSTIDRVTPDLIQALVGILEVKDLSTAAHTWRVVLYTRSLAESHRLDRELITRLSHAAALHDVGKIDIPDGVLQKPGPLTPAERAVIETHAALGHERLVRMDETDELVLGLVRHHHERWDGAGYPDRLKGERIPLGARYFAVIDAFDAMTSIRPYRKDVGEGAGPRAIIELERGKGSRYCAECVESFVDLYDTGQLGWIQDHFNDHCPVPDYAALADVDGVVKSSRK